ncbi:UTP--glucose-1-phosphate uridylyltransferase [Sedimentisphaera salicampi]|uniref:Putative uridylyltransferase n=1 Tax=Sedimentisphaera salicampi TaxID=1941349 RepID=A0A1W6LJY7_9BACT|nr:UDPGP type 1 family protein [Sedimentisphaera salicampi]ARN56087.1 putative uridylyltransferase [Sedimentisphaera salicampi]OXU15819.1 putative uridylyltransferase [Sedimentisphaera salicampi]
MSLTEKYEKLKHKLNRIGQEQLLRFWEELEETKRERLLRDIEQLEFENIPRWVEKYVKREHSVELPSEFDPAPYFKAEPPKGQEETYADAKAVGEDLIRQGKVGAFVVAGGQGTRLGFGGPKGCYPVSPVKNKTLFQIFAETILFANRKYGAKIPWYVMTSPLNHNATVQAFEENNYFGLDKNDVYMFEQGTMPNFQFDGKIFLSEKDEIAKSPDGHGGSLKALYARGAVADMQKRGIEHLSYFQVDNPLIQIMDPLFIGLHAKADAEMSSKALIKGYPKEKVGNFCLVNGRVNVIEYSDLPDEEAEKKNPDGSLVFQLGSIAIHIISRSFIEDINSEGFALPFHRAVKKIPHVNKVGEKVKPEEKNGIKLETFVFDALPMAGESVILETLREEEFAPVKNKEGVDSPAVTREMMTERAAKWLEAAGVDIPRTPEGKADCIIEMSPLFAACINDIIEKKSELPEFEAGKTYYLE